MKNDQVPRPVTTALARAYVASILAATLQSDIGNGSEWIEQHPDDASELDDAGRRRVVSAITFWQRRLARAAAKGTR